MNAILQALIAFGLPLTAQQEASIGVVVNALILLILAGSHAYSTITAERERWSHLNGPEG